MLKSNVSSNKNEIKGLKDIIAQLQNEIDQLKKMGRNDKYLPKSKQINSY
jgi:conjugal transfer/entry exclusion protein